MHLYVKLKVERTITNETICTVSYNDVFSYDYIKHFSKTENIYGIKSGCFCRNFVATDFPFCKAKLYHCLTRKKNNL